MDKIVIAQQNGAGAMARYKPYDLNQAKMIPLSYADQIVEGSFEHALNDIVEEHLDLTVFEKRYANDETGRPAYDPKVLLKVVLYGYYKGIISSRMLAEACRRNVVFMALSADTRPHFTTLAGFVSSLDREIVGLFRDVLLYASELGLIGKEHFAVDGCKLPSNASKQWSGTHRELEEKRKKLERVAERIVERHRERDGQEPQAVEPVDVPSINDRLQHATNRGAEEHDLRDRVDPREPEGRTEEIPLRSVHVLGVADAEGRHAPHADQRVSDEQQEHHEARHFEQVKGSRAKPD